MSQKQLHAAMASIPVPPPIGADMVGFLRRYEPIRRYGQPLEVGVLVVDDGQSRAAIVALDLIGTPGKFGQQMRKAVAQGASCPVGHVLANSQHTHAAPPPPGLLKMGGAVHSLTTSELGYWEHLVQTASSAASIAASELRPARLGTGRAEVEGLSVNRRERLEDGSTILGWNPDEMCDRGVSVLRFDDLEGNAIGSVVSFACHPVVVGPDVAESSSDFVGALRQAVRAWTGGECLFLQGCAGNVLPLECFMEAPGPEVAFGRELALAALKAHTAAQTRPRELVRSGYGSAVPIARYRWEASGEFAAEVSVAERIVDFPLDPTPTLAEMAALRQQLEARADHLKASGAGQEQWNPVALHALWAAEMEERIKTGRAERSVKAPVQALRIGQAGIVGLPGEPFNEIGVAIREASPAPFTMVCGYSNDAIAYFPTTAEHAHGGYEVQTNHRHYGHPSALAVGVDKLLIESSTDLLTHLFAHA